MSWLVVHFPKEDSVAAIPSTWYLQESGKAVWPPENLVKRHDVVKYIKKRTNPNEHWPSYKCVIWGKYDDFKTAQKKAKKAEKTKNLTSTGDEERGKGFRKKKSLQFVDYERKSSSSSPGDNSESTDSDSDSFPQEPRTLTSKKNGEDNPSAQVNLATSHNMSMRDESSSTNFETQLHTRTGIAISQGEQQGANKEDMSSNCNCTISSMEKLHRSVLRELYLQTAKLHDIENLIRELTVINPTSANNNQNDNEELMAALSLMPVDEEKLLELEEFLTKNRKNCDNLINHLKLLGGSSCKEITKRILYKLFTDEAGLLYSWQGAKKKKVFKNLKIATVIIESVRNNEIAKNSTDHEIICYIKQWLVKCQSRINNKNKKKNQQVDDAREESSD